MSGCFWDGRKFRTFDVVNEHQRDTLAIEVAGHLSLPAKRTITDV